MNDEEFDLACFKKGETQVSLKENKALIQCFDEYCGMFGSQPKADLVNIAKKAADNLETFNDDENSENEEYQCVKKAITNPSKCYNAADVCDESCSSDLDKLKTCTDQEEKNCTYNIRLANSKLTN